MNPVKHVLTSEEKKIVTAALSELPPLHKKILREHLHSISFMDNMPNTALTSPVDTLGGIARFNIVFRAEILHETISQWATWKENACYTFSEDRDYKVVVEAGNLDAILYVLLHEATHVVDAVLNLTPHDESEIAATDFTEGIWQKMNLPVETFCNPLLETTRFRSGNPISILSAPEVYKELGETPFVSLYSMASWFEDIAELVTIYHLTVRMKQPYKVIVSRNGALIAEYEPSKNDLVQKRQGLLKVFYD
ncbi:hypothetical protein [uncultured Chryseobacterium sp.]|uniref:hypothetical protein n=1 Tax=uncultured Chryseobacterium sp. TaxID=259322 RepID=UPI002620DBCA|nr:hypothetical protein [uncultured Chryseobacterium sp.]